MKKWVLLVVFCLLLTGCSLLPDTSGNSGEDAVTTTTTTTTTTTNTTATTTTSPAFISEDRAMEIAADYWNFEYGDRDPDTGFLMTIMLFDTPTAEAPQYEAVLKWLVTNDENDAAGHWSTVDWIWIDAITEEIATESHYG